MRACVRARARACVRVGWVRQGQPDKRRGEMGGSGGRGEQGHGTSKDTGPARTRDQQGPGTRDQGPGTSKDQGPARTRDRKHRQRARDATNGPRRSGRSPRGGAEGHGSKAGRAAGAAAWAVGGGAAGANGGGEGGEGCVGGACE